MNNSKTNLSDLAFEFIIPENITYKQFDFQHKTKEWNGVQYNQGLPESDFGSNFKLIKTSVPDHHLRQLPKQYGNANWCCVSIQGKGLEIFADSLFNNGIEEKGFALKDLVENLLEFGGKWAVIFEPDYDFKLEIKEGTIGDILHSIAFSIMNEKIGFIYFGECYDNK